MVRKQLSVPYYWIQKCKICKNDINVENNKVFMIKNVPENTFNFSEKTIDLQMIECPVCGAVQLYDVPISEDYDVVYRSIGTSLDYREQKKKQLKKIAKKYLLLNNKDKKVLEAGCGDGQFLEIFRELGIECHGIEQGADNLVKCIDKGFFVSDLETGLNDDNYYDAIFSFHFLEHLPDPQVFINDLYFCLKEGGICCIEVPNYDYINENSIWLEFTKDHRFYYCKRTLSLLLLKAGFEIETIEENNGGICLTIIARKPKNSNFNKMQEKMNNDFKDFFKLTKSLNHNFSVYGAGHYSQLLLTTLYKETGLKPNRIFDSNPQKCGQKLCGIEIESKENVDTCKDSIIIICGVYSLEVYDMLKTIFTLDRLFIWE